MVRSVPLYIILNHVLNKIRKKVLIQQATNKQASEMTVFYRVLFGAKKESANSWVGSIFLYVLDKIWGTFARNKTVLFDSKPTPEHPYLPSAASNPSCHLHHLTHPLLQQKLYFTLTFPALLT